MASMRVHELAKEFDMSSGDLLDRLKEMKIPAKSHASMLNEAYVDKIRKNLEPEIRARAGALAAEEEAALAAEKEEAERQRAARLAQTIVLTSQGTPFIFAGEEIFRDKKGVHNSYCSPDSINAIDWNLKHANAEQMAYYRELIKLRKAHPAFRMTTTADVARHLKFDKTEPGLISYSLTDNANGDVWKEIKVIFNGSDEPREVKIPKGNWTVIAEDGKINAEGLSTSRGGKLTAAPRAALILAREK